jgi:hypothetical protein
MTFDTHGHLLDKIFAPRAFAGTIGFFFALGERHRGNEQDENRK